jgi:hypothetical protein
VTRRTQLTFEALAIFAIAAAVRLAGIQHEALHDELHHVLSAMAYVDTGSFSIADGKPYVRAMPFTWTIAGLFSVFGESLLVARAPAVVAGALLATVVYLWLAVLRERAAGWIAALLLAIDPEAIVMSQWARFYTWQQLSFLLGTAATFALLLRPTLRRSLVFGGMAASLFAFGISLQPTCAIGVAGVAVAVLPILGHSVFSLGPARRGLAVGASALLVVLTAVAWWTGIFDPVIALATYVDLQAASGAGYYRYYYGILADNYGGLWPLFPLLLLIAARRQPLLAWFAGAVFAVALVTHSVLPWKSWRYFAYAMPFFFIAAGLGVVEAIRMLGSALPGLMRRLAPIELTPALLRKLSLIALIACVGFWAAGNRAFLSSARLLGTHDSSMSVPGMEGTLSWSSARSMLDPMVAAADVVITSDALKAIYYLGRANYEISRTHLYRREGARPEFSRDRPTGLPVISEPSSLNRLLNCYDTGLIVIERVAFGVSSYVPDELARFISEKAESVELPPEWGLVVFRWSGPQGDRSTECPPRVDSAL